MMPEEKSFEVWNDYGVENFDEMVNLFAAFLDDTESEQAEQLGKWVKKHIQPIDFSTTYDDDFDTAYDFYHALFAEGLPFEECTLKSFLANLPLGAGLLPFSISLKYAGVICNFFAKLRNEIPSSSLRNLMLFPKVYLVYSNGFV